MNKCYEFKQKADEVTELLIYGDITSTKWDESDATAFDFALDLAECKGDLVVRINSYGGEVSQALAMYNLLRDYAEQGHKVTTICDGFACSAASVVFMAGDNRQMNEGTLLMIHNAWTVAQGNADELRKQADDLEKANMPSVQIYTARTGLDEAKVRELMDAETWLTPEEALGLNFCTSIIEREAEQSINEQYLFKSVAKEKEMERTISELRNRISELEESNKPADHSLAAWFASKK